MNIDDDCLSEENEHVQSSNEEKFDSRWDITGELHMNRKQNKWKLILDGMGRTMEGNTKGVALAIHKNNFLIATNKEFSRGIDTQDKDYLLIDRVMNYFKSVAQIKDNFESYKKTFKYIGEPFHELE